MAKHKYPESSENYSFYSDLLWCSVPLTGMACYYYGMRPALLMLAGLLTAYLFDCALAPLHGEGYRSHEPSSECFAALIVLMMPATVSYAVVVAAVIASVLAKEAFGGCRHGGRRYFLAGTAVSLPRARHKAAHLKARLRLCHRRRYERHPARRRSAQ